MSGNLKGKVALVTGASRGIGKGIAIALGQVGALVYITGRSIQVDNSTDSISGNLLETKSLVEKAGGTCIAVPVDHRDDEQIKSLFEQIDREQNGQLDLLVNNAYGGVRSLIDAKGKPFWEADLSLWDACNQVGLRSHYVASHFAAKMMTNRKRNCSVPTIPGQSEIEVTLKGLSSTAISAARRSQADLPVP